MLTVNRFAAENIWQQPFRSVILILFVFICTVSLFVSSFLTDSMASGINEARKQTYADIIVVPSGFDENAKGTLFEGRACTMMFKENPLAQVEKTEGVAKASQQLLLETLELSCCTSGQVQVIAIDTRNDFTVNSWLGGNKLESIGNTDLIVGSEIGLKKGEVFYIYGKEYRVSNVLEETGTGYDSSVFISYDSVNDIIETGNYREVFGDTKNANELASMILVKTDSDYPTETVNERLKDVLLGQSASPYTVSSIIGGLSEQLDRFNAFGLLLDFFVILLSLAALFSFITVTARQRRNRVGSLLSVGISRSKIIRIYILEYFYLLLIGFAAGITVACIFVFPLYPAIRQTVSSPFHIIDLREALWISVKIFLTLILILGISVSSAFYEILRHEPAQLAEEQA